MIAMILFQLSQPQQIQLHQPPDIQQVIEFKVPDGKEGAPEGSHGGASR